MKIDQIFLLSHEMITIQLNRIQGRADREKQFKAIISRGITHA